MLTIYNFDLDTAEELLQTLARNMQRRRLEKGLSREALSELSGVPAPTIAKFEQKYAISLASYVALAKALGYAKDIKQLLSEPLYATMEELDMIHKNKNRKRGRNEMGKYSYPAAKHCGMFRYGSALLCSRDIHWRGKILA